MGYLGVYGESAAEFFKWISSVDTQIPVIRLLQGLAAIVGVTVSALGLYKAWRYAEHRLGHRLSEFLDEEEKKVIQARGAIKCIRDSRSVTKFDQIRIFSNPELRMALKYVRRRRVGSAAAMLAETLGKTQEREILARSKASLHEKQRAMTHLLLGALEDSRQDHHAALAHFQAALEIDEHDIEAREYVGIQYLKLGDATQALIEFDKLVEVAESNGDDLLLSQAHKNRGRAFELLPIPSFANANIAYRDSIQAFPQNGPPLEIAYINELRGLVNIQLGNVQNAHTSLMGALTRYTQLERASKRDMREAAEGVRRVHAALRQLEPGNDLGAQQPEIAASNVAVSNGNSILNSEQRG